MALSTSPMGQLPIKLPRMPYYPKAWSSSDGRPRNTTVLRQKRIDRLLLVTFRGSPKIISSSSSVMTIGWKSLLGNLPWNKVIKYGKVEGGGLLIRRIQGHAVDSTQESDSVQTEMKRSFWSKIGKNLAKWNLEWTL